VPALKTLAFRLFGSAVVAFRPAVYLGNRATVGSNQCLGRDQILVDHITLEDGAELGQLGMITPGLYIGKATEVGVGAAVRLRATIGAGVVVGPCSGIGHGLKVGGLAKSER
jgi:UDP-3-O-[3-hydroxymyristoyl] glucosamine N-acyltransferase